MAQCPMSRQPVPLELVTAWKPSGTRYERPAKARCPSCHREISVYLGPTYHRHSFPQPRPVSKKRARLLRERRKVTESMKRDGPVMCELRLPGCTGRADDWDERLLRSRGGSATDPANRIVTCRHCHDWKHQHPKEAHELGIMPHAWEGK